MRLVIALALLIACRRRKGGGTNNLCAHRFQRVMAEPRAVSRWKFLQLMVRAEIYLQAGLRTLPFVCRSRRIKNELSSRQIALRPPKQTANGFSSGTHPSRCFILFSLFLLPGYSRTITRVLPFRRRQSSLFQSDEISQALAHIHLQYNPLLSYTDVLGALLFVKLNYIPSASKIRL